MNLLAQHPEWKQYLTSRVVMTPHMGEMGRLTGKKVSELQKDRIAAARELAAETGAVCVLKDACTVTAAPDGNTWISLAGNPGMATAGSGDVLTGILAGVLAMFLNKRTELPDTGRTGCVGSTASWYGRRSGSERKRNSRYEGRRYCARSFRSFEK